jgi:signal transduction histidine kinase
MIRWSSPEPADRAGLSGTAARTRLGSPATMADTVARLVGLTLLLLNLFDGRPGAGLHGQQLAVLILGGTSCAAWVVWALAQWLFPARLQSGAALALPITFGLLGAALAGLVPGTAAVFPAAATLTLAVRTRTGVALSATSAFVATAVIVGLATGQSLTSVLAWSGAFFGLYGLGQARRSRARQAEAAERLLAETERADSGEAHSAALAERSRIAREIHDVLAHSLSALTVQLEAADALLTGGNPDRAHEYVVKARRIAREGLVETRRAITALREDAAPLPVLLDSLAENYRIDLGVKAAVSVLGEPRPLGADAALAVYRTAQESLTNIRKHAPGAEVELTLAFEPEHTRLTVANGPAPGGPSPLAGSGGGYGLAGLRERAELAAGTLTAQPVCVDGTPQGWAVTLTIPAMS